MLRGGLTQPPGRRYRPRGLRIKLYEEVLRLREQGLGYEKIRRRIEEIYGERLLTATISRWIRRIHSPHDRRRIPSIEFLRPSKELAYVIGAVMGDGTVWREKRRRKGYNEVYVELAVKDREFIEKFSRCLGTVLDREPPRVRYSRSLDRYVTIVKSKTLFELLCNRDLDRIKPYVEHDDKCMASFLQGLCDSEGSVDKNGTVKVVNSNYELLQYVKESLKGLSVEATGPYLKMRKGTSFKSPTTGKIYRAKKDIYYIYIRRRSLLTFYQRLGFTIIRKQKRLEEYLRRRGLLPT